MDKNFFLCPRKNVHFKFWFPVSKEHNYDKFLSNIKSKDSFKIRIVLVFQKMSKIVILGTPEAEKLHISRWPKYCETPGM